MTFGWSVGAAGDVNGDGFADFLVGDFEGSGNSGEAHLYLGTATPSVTAWNGTSATKRIALTSPDGATSFFGISVASAGDVNGDGFIDFLVGAYGASSNSGAAHLYLGAATPSAIDWNGTSPTKRIDLADPDGPNANFGVSVAGAGDVNGDGFADFLVGAYNARGAIGAAHLYLGGTTPNTTNWNGTPPTKRVDLASPDGGSSYGYSVARAANVSSNSYADTTVSARDATWKRRTGSSARRCSNAQGNQRERSLAHETKRPCQPPMAHLPPSTSR